MVFAAAASASHVPVVEAAYSTPLLARLTVPDPAHSATGAAKKNDTLVAFEAKMLPAAGSNMLVAVDCMLCRATFTNVSPDVESTLWLLSD